MERGRRATESARAWRRVRRLLVTCIVALVVSESLPQSISDSAPGGWQLVAPAAARGRGRGGGGDRNDGGGNGNGGGGKENSEGGNSSSGNGGSGGWSNSDNSKGNDDRGNGNSGAGSAAETDNGGTRRNQPQQASTGAAPASGNGEHRHHHHRPPRTVEEWVKGWWKSDDSDKATAAAGTDASGKTSTSASAASTATATAKVSTGRAPDLWNVKIGATATNEVLAVNPSPGLLARAAERHFTVDQAVAFRSLSLKVLRLVPPVGMDADTARRLLEQDEATSALASNYVYRPYRPQSGQDKAAAANAAVEAGPACAGDRCYARGAIRWNVSLQRCASRNRIGFIDTAVDLAHPALDGRDIHVREFRRGGKPTKGPLHGTSTLAILAGAPGGPVAGLLPFAPYLVADIFFADERGEPATDTLSLLSALDWMGETKARIVNMSLAGPPDPLMEAAIARLARQGIVFVAAAGNNGADDKPLYPAGYPDVIAVSAVARDLRIYRHANRGAHIDVVAPGVGIWTAAPGGGGYQSGTSFAAPYVTAVVATIADGERPAGKDALLSALDYRKLGAQERSATYGRGLVQAPTQCGDAVKPADKPAEVSASAPQPPTSAWTTATTTRGPSPASGSGSSGSATAFGFRN